MLTFEDQLREGAPEAQPFKGVAAIIEKLQELPFGKVDHQVATTDAQPSGDDGGIVIMVTGGLLTEREDRPKPYVQIFRLLPEAGTYFVQNDMCRLVDPAA